MRCEVVLDRLPEALLQHRVRIERATAERFSGGAGGGRLAGAHEADEDQCLLAYGRRRFHPIRCS